MLQQTLVCVLYAQLQHSHMQEQESTYVIIQEQTHTPHTRVSESVRG